MANGSRVTSILPSATGGALTRATGVLLETQLARMAAEREDRQLDIADRANAINQFVTLAGFTPPGTTLGDLGTIGARLFERGWGMSSEGLDALEMNPQTLQNVIERAGIEGMEEGGADWRDLLLPSVRALMGLEPDEDVAALAGLEARMKADALTDITRDPELMGEYMSRLLGRDPVTLRIPGIDGAPDREIEFNSAHMAQIYAEFLQVREKFSMELNLKDDDKLDKFIEEIQAAVLEGKHSVSSTALRGRILPMYQEAVQTGDASAIQAFLDDPQVAEGQKLAIQYLIGSIGAGEEAFLSNLPPELANFFRLGARIREILGPEAAEEVLPSITENLQPGFSAVLTDRWLRGLNLSFSRGGSPVGAPPTGGTEVPGAGVIDLSQVPREDLLSIVETVVREGEMGIEDLAGAGVPQDVIDEAFPAGSHRPSPTEAENTRIASIPQGGLDPDSVPPDLREVVVSYNQGLEAQAALSRPSPVIQARLERVRQNIDARLQFSIRNEPVDVTQYETERERAIARRMNTLIRVRLRATNPERIRQLGERIESMARELDRAGA